MTQTARRRWTRELDHEVDGLALGAAGPVILHSYDPPAGGRWVEDAIPGKLGAFDRNSGETLWRVPCEVGYGRGFGAGFGPEDDVVVMGPGSTGHRIVRMALGTGELVDMADTEAFDEACIGPEVCVTVSPQRVLATATRDLVPTWSYSREGERYRHVARSGGRVFVVYTNETSKRQGVLALSAETGEVEGVALAPKQPVIHDLAADERGIVLLVSDLASALPRELLTEYLTQLPDDQPVDARTLALVAFEPTALDGDAPLWYEVLGGDTEYPEESITTDSDKLYVVRGALLEVRDVLTGRALGDWAIPGLDQRVGWTVRHGAGLLAEETRASVFELPA